MKQQILDELNEIIVGEKGTAVGMNDMFLDSDLDSLGITLTLLELETSYPIFKGLDPDADAFALLDIKNLSVRDLITKCVYSISPIGTE